VSMRLALAVILTVFTADRLTKLAVMTSMQVGEQIPVIPGLFSLTYIRNPGAAFGLLAQSGPWREVLLVGVAIAAALGLGWLMMNMEPSQRWERAAAAAVIGGAIGNLYDRLAYGEVIDFVDLYVGRWHWPAFNVADSFITVGVSILILLSFLSERHEVRPAD
jgi:signal peptidase II